LTSNYSTTTQMNVAIATALSPYITTSQANTNYYSKSATDTLLNAKLSSTLLDSANGIPTLDASGKVKISQLPYGNLLSYKGTWTNATTLANGTGSVGDVYISGQNVSYNFGAGSVTIRINDWIVYNGSAWQVNTGNDQISSWNSRTGAVIPVSGDYDTWYYTKTQLDASIGGLLPSSAISAYSTTVQMNDAISLALTPYITTSQANTNYLAKSGGTLTGFLILHSDPTLSLHSATKQYVDNYSYSKSVADAKYQLQSAMLTDYYTVADCISIFATQSTLTSNYSTTTAMNSAITTALTPYALTSALADYVLTSSLGSYVNLSSNNAFTGTQMITNNAQCPLLIQQSSTAGNAISEIGILSRRTAVGTNYKSRLWWLNKCVNAKSRNWKRLRIEINITSR
jgi:hypothetical protein